MANELKDRPGSEYQEDWRSHEIPGIDTSRTASDGDLPEKHPDNLEGAYNNPSAESPGGLKRKEESADGKASADAAAAAEADRVGKGFSGDDAPGAAIPQRLRGLVTRKRAGIGVTVAGFVGGGLFGFSLLSGPAQFVQFMHLMQKFHFTRSEDFGDDRGGKVLLYALLGKGSERGRLSTVGNKPADKWEEFMLKQSGLRPVFTKRTGRFIGFEIDNLNRFQNFAGGFDEKNTAKLEELMGKGVEIRDAKDANTMQEVVRGGGKRISPDSKIIDASAVSFRNRRILVRTMHRSTGTLKIVSAVASRMEIKRFGIDFHPLKNIVRGENDKLEFRKKVLTDWIKGIKSGVTARTLGTTDKTDADGNPVQSDADKAASDEASKAIEEAAAADGTSGESGKAIRNTIAKGASPAMAVGILCTAKSFGNDIENYKYVHNFLPMMRMGGNLITMGEQVKSGVDTNMDELGVYSELFYDKETGRSWMSARSIQAELGEKQTGPDLAEEAQLKNIGSKPQLFNTLDGIPGLGSVCGVLDAVGNLPVIKQVSGAAASIINSITHVDDLVAKALAAASGQSVDAIARGADLGNLANVGSFLLGNDHALSMGGAAMSNRDALALQQEEAAFDNYLNSNAPIASRYLDPYDTNSLAGKAVRSAPSNPAQFASLFANPLRSIGSIFSSSFSSLTSRVQAAEGYDYGLPEIGFTLEEQRDGRFENPYENAAVIETGDRLNQLNDKYSECFGVKAVPEGVDGVRLENVKGVNALDLQKEEKCDPKKNSDEMFLRYRFYIADLVAAKSNACYIVDDDASCAEIGANGETATSASGASASSGEGGAKIAAVAEKEYAKNGNKFLETCGSNCGPEVQKYTGGPSGPDAPWCAWFVSWVYREAGYEFKGSPAGSDGNIPAVVNLVTWFKEHGIHFTPSSSQYKPQPGDVVMYGGDEHTGIVVKVNGDNIETVEGNTSGDGSFNADGGTVGRKSYNYKEYNSRSIEFGRLKRF